MKIIFLHGFAADHHVFEGYDVLGWDSLFFDIHFDENSEPILPEIVEDSILVGWSMGGMVALKILALFPEKIKGLILISSAPSYIVSEVFPEGKLPEAVNLLQNSIVNGEFRAMQNFQRQLFSINEIKDGWLNKFRKEIGGKIRVTLEDLIRSLNFLSSFEAAVVNIKIPVLVLHGKDDSVVSFEAINSWKRIFPEIKTYVFDAGHALPFVAKDKVVDIIDDLMRSLKRKP